MAFRILILKRGYENYLAISKSYTDQNLNVHILVFVKSGLLFNILYCPYMFANKHFSFHVSSAQISESKMR